MQKEYKLKKRASFNYIYRKGAVFSNKDFVLYLVKTKGTLKIGFSVSKKVGGSVQRNRVKRQMRESVRLMIPEIDAGYNFIFVARSTVYGKKSSEIADSMRPIFWAIPYNHENARQCFNRILQTVYIYQSVAVLHIYPDLFDVYSDRDSETRFC